MPAKLIKPPRLNPGDVVALVAPASAPPDPKAIDRSVAALERLGFKPRLARNVRRRWGFLAGSDRERAADLMNMFTDPAVKAIVCVRGGYGASRLLTRLNYQTIASHPKILVGYSDITSLHCALLGKANLVSFHGPMMNSDFIQDTFPEFTLNSFLRTLSRAEAPGSICQGYRRQTVTILRRGRVSAPLMGGNLTLLCASLGTTWQPVFKDRILFFEDLDEVPYRFDRMLTQLLNAGLLQQVVGIAIGINKNCTDPKARTAKEYRQSLEDVFRERLLPLRVPVVMGLPFGHIPHNATLPVGLKVTLDAHRGDLALDESAVV
jgi:muramoyltetrapeptide carboxypeptidase